MTPPEANTGETVGVTISGTHFGLNPTLQIGGVGVNATITSSSPTQITAYFSVADATIIGTRGVQVKSRGISGTTFQTTPQTSDLSNSVGFNVFAPTASILPITSVVEKDYTQTITVSTSGTTRFTIKNVAGAGTGEARFSDNNSTDFIVTGATINRVLTIKGITRSSQAGNMTVEATADGNPTILDHEEFTVAEITAIVYEKANSDDFDLDANPGNGVAGSAGGLRIYPDKKTPLDTTDRSLIKVKFTVQPAVPNLKVYVGSFDLDDPSATGLPIDPTGNDGKDNNGAVNGSKSGDFVAGGDCTTGASSGANPNFVSKITCITSATTTTATYKVTMQPGDNFTLTANLRSAKLFDGYSIIGGLLVDGDYNEAIQSPTLTVWRKLHIEVDSMGNAVGNNVKGTINDTRKVGKANQTLNLSVGDLELNRFENGRIVIKRGNDLVADRGIIKTTATENANTSSSVTFANPTPFAVQAGDTFTLYDDDDMNNDDGTTLNGDEDDDVREPDTSLITNNSSNPTNNLLASAYIVPRYDLNGSHTVIPFSENITSADINNLYLLHFNNIAYEASVDFWTVYIVGIYQWNAPTAGSPRDWDSDPIVSRTTGLGHSFAFAKVDIFQGIGVAVFEELNRPTEYDAVDNFNFSRGFPVAPWASRPVNESRTVVHELGHIFHGYHTDHGLMDTSNDRTVGIFSDTTLNKMRGGKFTDFNGVINNGITHP